MNLWDALWWPQSLPFSIALATMMGIALLEGAGALIGASVSTIISGFGDTDTDVADTDISGETPSGALSRTLGWLRIGKVPVLIGLIIMLTMFGLGGITIQATIANIFGTPVNPWIMAPAVAIAILPVVRWTNGALSKLMPTDDTQVVSSQTFIGRTGVVTLGPTRRGRGGQCRIRDEYGHTHYVMIEPDTDDEEFNVGDKVLLVREMGNQWRVIAGGNDQA